MYCIRKRIQLNSNQVKLMREFAQQYVYIQIHTKHTLVVDDERTRKHRAHTYTHIKCDPKDIALSSVVNVATLVILNGITDFNLSIYISNIRYEKISVHLKIRALILLLKCEIK